MGFVLMIGPIASILPERPEQKAVLLPRPFRPTAGPRYPLHCPIKVKG
jgi:hypothetical protein